MIFEQTGFTVFKIDKGQFNSTVDALEKMGKKVSPRFVRASLKRRSGPMREDARRRARPNWRTRMTIRAIKIGLGRTIKGSSQLAMGIDQRVFGWRPIRKRRAKKGKTVKTRMVMAIPWKYARLVELGTNRSKAYPFMGPAYEAHHERISNNVIDDILDEVGL